ncbi:LytTR family DNA-binding domain-containing protein [Fusobacterium sp.]|uniref:LytTR family DNA-binding domain-containing protein n=1 Tax=Fusobacterium sp. TaxID=68766 RepID=UPI002904F11C|nr:LytTR family DNA-binding domain-containing protein [Fusobacterium sp.]MDU1910485.1 LytTR family DNA-binding domain-containing protein [Fusobacterium sp.]
MKFLFYGDDLFFYLLKETFTFDIGRVENFEKGFPEETVLITDNNIFNIENISFDNLKKIYIYSDRVETKFLKRYSDFINKISFHGRDEYIFFEKFFIEKLDKVKLDKRNKVILSDSFKDVVIPMEDIEYFSYDRNQKKSFAIVDGNSYFLKKSLTEIEKFMEDSDFIRIERGIILNIKKIKEIDYKEEYVMTNSGQKIYLGRSILKKISENYFEDFYRL